MKGTIIKIITLILLFFAIVTGYIFLNREKVEKKEIIMGEPTLPTVTLYGMAGNDSNTIIEVNELFGYKAQMDSKYMRDTITPISGDRKVTVHVRNYGNYIMGAEFELRTLDCKRLIEDTTVEKAAIVQDGEYTDIDIQFQDMIEKDTEYVLVLRLNTDLADQTLDRLTKLNIEIKVTPIKYTTVTWLLDGVQIAEGTIIDQTLPMGVHVLKIVATTTVGKTTSRTLNITVTAAATDPAPAGSDIHETLVKQGTKATMHGSNISKVAKVIIGGTAVDATYNEEGDYIEYTVPELADGVYKLQLQDQEGNIFEAGEIELNTNPQYSGEKVIYTGPSEKLAWGAIKWENEEYTNLGIKPGMIITAYVTADAGAEGAIATGWWNDINSGMVE